MPDPRRLLTRSGLAIWLEFEGQQKSPNRDAWDIWYTAWSNESATERVCVRILSPMTMDLHLKNIGVGSLEENRERLGLLAVLDNVEGLADLPPDQHGNRIIAVSAAMATMLVQRPRLSDRELRRFMARRIYDAYSRKTLSDPFTIGGFDILVCGVSATDVLRNAQLFEEEGYLTVASSSPDSVTVRPKARLVREVERYGALREDAVEEADVLSAIGAYQGLKTCEPAITLEYRRYTSARTAVELESVFRSVAPIVENGVKDVLKARGSATQHATLGPAIADLRQRGLGNVALWSQLNHVLKFARDLSQHGSALPEPVLRIACENCFQLLPQLGALYP